jgi:hypothetical protein
MLNRKGLYSITYPRTNKDSQTVRVFRSGRDSIAPEPVVAIRNLRFLDPPYRVLLLLALALLPFGCAGEPKAERPRNIDPIEARLLFGDDPAPPESDADSPPSAGGGFTILLATVPPALRDRPEVMIAQVGEMLGTTQARLLPGEGDRPARIVFGSYNDPASPRAQSDLKRVRETVRDGARPFGGAVMVPEAVHAPSDERLARFDLRRARKQHGSEFVYTLQIGVYAREDNRRPSAPDLAAFRGAAEEAVERLRREGEQAFFYHGPNGSMVTVGLFNDGDLDASVVPPLESSRLKEIRARHPHNLLNGRGVREMSRRADGQAEARLQESRLVLIPD